MKKDTMRFAAILLSVITVLVLAGGIAGYLINQRNINNADSPLIRYQTSFEGYKAESEEYIARGRIAIENIDQYAAQIKANAEVFRQLGGDPAKLLESAETVEQHSRDSLALMESMEKRLNDLNAKKEVAPGATKDEINKLDNDVMRLRNAIRSSIRKLTKIDETESTKSLETKARQACEKSAADVCAAYPEAQLGDQFVGRVYVASAKEETEVQASFKDQLEAFLISSREYLLWLSGCFAIAAALCFIGWKREKTLKKIGSVANKSMMLIALVVITLIFFVLTNHTLLTPNNVSNIINQNAYIIVLACGMLLCIVCSGNIDLSVGRVIGFIAACAAKFMIEAKMPTIPSIILCLLIGIAIGAWQGFWIAYVRIPAFIVTLAGQLTFYGLTMKILQGFTIAGFPSDFQAIFCSFLPDPFHGSIFGIQLNCNVLALLVGIVAAGGVIFLQVRNRIVRARKGYTLEPIGVMLVRTIAITGVVLWLFNSLSQAKGVPSVLFTVGIVLLIYAYITGKTVIGRHLYAMGGNVNAARLSGVKTQKMVFLAYVNMGLLAALAGLVYAARLNAASPQAGQGDELYAIASCYIGGASAYGGIGTVGGTLIGALTMGVIKNGMSIMGLGQDIQQIVLGLVLLIAVVIDVVSKQKIQLPFLSKRGLHKGKPISDTTSTK